MVITWKNVHLNYVTNKQIACFLLFQCPHIVVENLQYSESNTVLYAISTRGILVIIFNAHFVEDDNGNAFTVNQVCYRKKIIRPFVRDLNRFFLARNLDYGSLWFQYGGVTRHGIRHSCLSRSYRFESFWLHSRSNLAADCSIALIL